MNIAERIKEFNKSLLQDKVQQKYKFMSESPYRFFRGSCHLFYEDLSINNTLFKSPLVWMCGDLHVENLGTFKGDNRLVYFDLNDFDEALLGPANWELVRMVTSIFVVFEYLSIDQKKALKWANLFIDSYFETLAIGKSRYIEPRIAKGIVKKFLDKVKERSQFDLIKKHTRKKKKEILLNIDNIKQYKIDPNLKEQLMNDLTLWLSEDEKTPYNYSVLDVCFRVAGTGSLGVNRYLFLLQNRKDKKDFLLLDLKQATISSVAPYISVPQPKWKDEADRTISIQKMMQNISPALLSTFTFQGTPFVVQEMQPVEDKIDFSLIKNRYRDVCEVITAMAILTASGQLRSCSRQGSATADELIEFGKTKGTNSQVIDYAIAYAEKVKSDYNNFLKFYNEGYFKNER